MNDEAYMLRALVLAEQGKATAPPNPWVGCVLVKNNAIVGEGFHESPGKPHAEAHALRQAGDRAKGATAYTTLEPCCHTDKRTPPCAEALVMAGVKKVVIGVQDPDPNVQGKGIALLESAGVEVLSGVLEDYVSRSLEPYLHQRRTGRAFCIAKAAISVDGRLAAENGSSKWITSEDARSDSHKFRAESQAVIVGSHTALRDHPRLNVRAFPVARQPLKVVMDREGRVPQEENTMVTDQSPGELLKTLADKGVVQAMVEGGGSVLGSFLRDDLINRLILYIGPRILGDQGIPLFRDFPIPTMAHAPRIRLLEVKQIDECMRLTYGL